MDAPQMFRQLDVREGRNGEFDIYPEKFYGVLQSTEVGKGLENERSVTAEKKAGRLATNPDRHRRKPKYNGRNDTESAVCVKAPSRRG